MNPEISKVVGHPLNLSEGRHTRSDNEASKVSATHSLGDGRFLPDSGGLDYGTGGVNVSEKGRHGPTGRV